LTEFDARSAVERVRERDALDVVQLHAELACFGEFLDRSGVLPHHIEDLAAHESVDGQAECRAVADIPVDHLLIES
jgi:hypothetical protein